MQDKKKRETAVIMWCPPSSKLPQWSRQFVGDPRYLKLILACDSLKASAYVDVHTVALSLQRSPSEKSMPKSISSSEAFETIRRPCKQSCRKKKKNLSPLTRVSLCSSSSPPVSQLPLLAGCERVTCVSKNANVNNWLLIVGECRRIATFGSFLSYSLEKVPKKIAIAAIAVSVFCSFSKWERKLFKMLKGKKKTSMSEPCHVSQMHLGQQNMFHWSELAVLVPLALSVLWGFICIVK